MRYVGKLFDIIFTPSSTRENERRDYNNIRADRLINNNILQVPRSGEQTER